MSVEKLDINHYDEIREIVEARVKLHPQFSWAVDSVVNYFNTDKDCCLYGYIENGLIQSTLGVWYWDDMPYTTIQMMLTRPGRNLFDLEKSGIGACFSRILADSEERGYFTHYSVRSIKELRVEYKKNIWKSFEERNPRYTGCNECFVPANTKPNFSTWWEVMTKRLHSYDAMIYSVRLRNEYRFREQFPGIDPEVLANA